MHREVACRIPRRIVEGYFDLGASWGRSRAGTRTSAVITGLLAVGFHEAVSVSSAPSLLGIGATGVVKIKTS